MKRPQVFLRLEFLRYSVVQPIQRICIRIGVFQFVINGILPGIGIPAYRQDKIFRTIDESILSNVYDAIGDSDVGQEGAFVECHFAYACDAIGNADGGQRGAKIERIISNACGAIWDGDGFQGDAVGKYLISNACDAIRDADGSQGIAIEERIVSNGTNAMGNGIAFRTKCTRIANQFLFCFIK